MISILISANSEWQAALQLLQPEDVKKSPVGDFFFHKLEERSLLFFHGGWGKVSAATTTQYVIDHWRPELIVNLGTCGGLAGQIKVNETVLVNETVYYDVIERMGDAQAAIDYYSTKLDLSFISQPYPLAVHVGRLASADQDIDPSMVNTLIRQYNVVAADWESGAIAWVAARNHTRCLILRGVTDVVSPVAGEIYNDEAVEFHIRAAKVMQTLIGSLPGWLDQIQ